MPRNKKVINIFYKKPTFNKHIFSEMDKNSNIQFPSPIKINSGLLFQVPVELFFSIFSSTEVQI